MTKVLKASVVIVSRHRPNDLWKVLTALKYQTMTAFEVVVVAPSADTQGLKAEFKTATFIAFDEANISKARNIGFKACCADIIAFCDDDSIPEIAWLERLLPAFEDPNVASAGGLVRGRNGINIQWSTRVVNTLAQEKPIDVDLSQPIFTRGYENGELLKLQGTNIAFRGDVLKQEGGFDENYQFYLDETDVLLRLGQKGWQSAFVPLAEVQHGFQKSARRTPARAPKSLFHEGRSAAYFLKQHADQITSPLNEMRHAQSKRIYGFLQNGSIGPWDVKALLQSLEEGIAEGLTLSATNPSIAKDGPTSGTVYISQSAQSPIAIFGNALKWSQMKRRAQKYQQSDHPVTVFRMTYTALFHRRYFSKFGFWVQAGGWFGRSDRDQKALQFKSRFDRMQKEQERHQIHRSFAKVEYIPLIGEVKVIDH